MSIKRNGVNLLLISTMALSMVACTNLGTPAQLAEKADTNASLAYAAIATAVNSYEQKPGLTVAQVASAENIKVQGWKALLVERSAYKAGQTIDLTALTALAVQAKTLLGAK